MRIWAVHKATFAFSAVQSSHHAHSRNVCKAGQRFTREAIPPSHRPLWHARPWRAACNCRPLPRVPRELCCWNCVHGSFSFFFSLLQPYLLLRFEQHECARREAKDARRDGGCDKSRHMRHEAERAVIHTRKMHQESTSNYELSSKLVWHASYVFWTAIK